MLSNIHRALERQATKVRDHIDRHQSHKVGRLFALADDPAGTPLSWLKEKASFTAKQDMPKDDQGSAFEELARIPPKQATKRTYDWHQQVWVTSVVMLQMDPEPFAKGGMRAAH